MRFRTPLATSPRRVYQTECAGREVVTRKNHPSCMLCHTIKAAAGVLWCSTLLDINLEALLCELVQPLALVQGTACA